MKQWVIIIDNVSNAGTGLLFYHALIYLIPGVVEFMLTISKIKYQFDLNFNFFYFLKTGLLFSCVALFFNLSTQKAINKRLKLPFLPLIDVLITLPLSVFVVIVYNNLTQRGGIISINELLNPYVIGILIAVKQLVVLLCYGKFFGNFGKD